MKRGAIAVFGSLNYDILFEVDRLPVPGETRAASSVSFAGGGKGANQAVQAALLGAGVEMVGAVGNDALGSDLLRRLEEVGVGTEHVHRLDVATGVGVVSFLEDGSIAAVIGRGANFAITRDQVRSAEPVFENAALAVLQLENPVELVADAATIAKRNRCTVILNAAPACTVSTPLRDATDILVVNEVEAAFFLGSDRPIGIDQCQDAGLRLREMFAAEVIITLGGDGSVVFSSSGPGTHIPARSVHAVETTGAGDSYVGAVAVALAEGRTLVEAAESGTRASSITVQGIGAQGAMPNARAIAAIG